MKRSSINRRIKEAIAFLDEQNFRLPPFAFWTPEQWASKGHECDEIRDCRLGWDLCDFGMGDFDRAGLLLFTIRNGHPTNPAYAEKTYCEKILISQEDQVCQMHYHWNKVEDIINRGGGNLVIKLYNATEDDDLADTDVEVSIDGVRKRFPAGTDVVLAPGESICLPQKLYHAFWAQAGHGPVLSGEVSKVNDDESDNKFHEPLGRFPEIEEDEPAEYLLMNEYPAEG